MAITKVLVRDWDPYSASMVYISIWLATIMTCSISSLNITRQAFSFRVVVAPTYMT